MARESSTTTTRARRRRAIGQEHPAPLSGSVSARPKILKPKKKCFSRESHRFLTLQGGDATTVGDVNDKKANGAPSSSRHPRDDESDRLRPVRPTGLSKGENLIDGGRCAEAIPILNDSVEELRASPSVVQARAWNLLRISPPNGRASWKTPPAPMPKRLIRPEFPGGGLQPRLSPTGTNQLLQRHLIF